MPADKALATATDTIQIEIWLRMKGDKVATAQEIDPIAATLALIRCRFLSASRQLLQLTVWE